MIYFLALLIAYFGIDAFVSIFRKIFKRRECTYDKGMKKYKSTAIIGGFSMITIFFIMVVLMLGLNGKTLGIMFSSLFISITGILEDSYKAKGKHYASYLITLLIQILASLLVCISGIRIYGMAKPFTGEYLFFPIWIQYIGTVLWMVSITNVIKLLNKINGLAIGISSITALTLFIIGLVMEQPFSALLAVILCGIGLGALKYNRNEIKVFTGNCSSMFLGFILSVIAVDGTYKSATILTLSVPFLIIVFPAIDRIVILINKVKGKGLRDSNNIINENNSIKEHEINRQQKAVVLYMVSILISFTSIVLLLIQTKH